MATATGERATAPVLVVMGVAGAGKSTVGRLLAERLGVPFREGDDLQPPENVAKMAAGIPLTDDDRWPWLERVAGWVASRRRAGGGGVVTCSALKRAYRDRIAAGGGVVFVFLVLDRETLHERLAHRRGHYMPAVLLGSQLETLEEPRSGEPVVLVPATASPEDLVDRILEQLGTTPGVPRQG
jgi:gluconokinase